MRKFWFGCVAALCAAGILAGAWIMAVPLFADSSSSQPQESAYYLRDNGGRVAVYASADSETPLAVYDIYVNLLPEGDALRLKTGMQVYGETALEHLLEDLGA
jgi:hypothetical protein